MDDEFEVTLHRQTGLLKSWKLFVYVQRSNYLQEYSIGTNRAQGKPREIIDIQGCVAENTAAITGRVDTFRLTTKSGKTLHLMAASKEEKLMLIERWSDPSRSSSPVVSISADSSAGTTRRASIDGSRRPQDVRRRMSLPESMRFTYVRNIPQAPETVKEEENQIAVVLANHIGQILEFNEQAQVIFGLTLSETLGKSITILMPEPFKSRHDGFLFRFEKFGSSGALNRTRRVQGERKNGEVFPLDILLEKTPEGNFKASMVDLSVPLNIASNSCRILSSIRLQVLEGKNIKLRKRSNLFCTIMIDHQFKARTSTQYNTNRPFWGEEIILTGVDLAPTNRILSIIVQSQSSNKEDVRPVGKIDFQIAKLKEADIIKGEWVNLVPAEGDASSTEPGELGALQLETERLNELILPMHNYEKLLQIVMDTSLIIPRALAKAADTKLEEISGLLLRIFIVNNRVNQYIKQLLSMEIQNTENSSIIFRGNSLATKSLDLYMKLVGSKYLFNTLQKVISDVYAETENCEIDPMRMQDQKFDISKNQNHLLVHVNRIWDAIQKSVKKVPLELTLVFEAMREEVIEQFGDGIEKYTAVSGFLFLRFFCPAVLSPYIFHLMSDHPNPTAARTLTLIAKTLQNLANLVEFGEKEAYMNYLNEFIIENKKSMRKFIDQVSAPSLEGYESFVQEDVDTCRDMAALYRHLSQRLDRIKEYADKTHPIYEQFLEAMQALEVKYQTFTTTS